MSKNSHIWWSLAAVGLLWPAWFLAARYTDFIGDPLVVLSALPAFLADRATWVHVGITVFRVYSGLLVGLAIGTLAAFAMNRSLLWNQILNTYVTIALRTPSAIAAIVALSLFKGAEYGNIIVVAFVTFPYLTVGLLTGLKSADRELDGMARIYRLGAYKHARHVLLPFITPYMFSAIRNIHALAWKVIVAVEIFGAAKLGFGAQFSNAWNYFLITQIHLWLLIFMAVVIIVEYCVLRPAERYTFRWRGDN
ncbi:MAG: ABC transporter permease [Pseudochelatococcus sp.]|jgi:NitT/TauT family transport system permease protein|uniref:ABC transporter permease n=1 Tax=Pseudochelatococcus sp. TaxID=2020869 RepID=UPI003D8F062A